MDNIFLLLFMVIVKGQLDSERQSWQRSLWCSVKTGVNRDQQANAGCVSRAVAPCTPAAGVNKGRIIGGASMLPWWSQECLYFPSRENNDDKYNNMWSRRVFSSFPLFTSSSLVSFLSLIASPRLSSSPQMRHHICRGGRERKNVFQMTSGRLSVLSPLLLSVFVSPRQRGPRRKSIFICPQLPTLFSPSENILLPLAQSLFPYINHSSSLPRLHVAVSSPVGFSLTWLRFKTSSPCCWVGHENTSVKVS